MVTVEKIQRGLTRYIEEQLINKTHGIDSWMVGLVLMYVANIPNIISRAAKQPLYAMSGAFAEDGTVDLDKIILCLKPGAKRNSAEVKLPITGTTINLAEQDLDIIADYIRRA